MIEYNLARKNLPHMLINRRDTNKSDTVVFQLVLVRTIYGHKCVEGVLGALIGESIECNRNSFYGHLRYVGNI